MSVSSTITSTPALFGAKLAAPSGAAVAARRPCVAAVIECSSRPQKKATAHHMKTRPRKSQPWDIRRKPTVYAPLPPLPPDWVLDAAAATVDADAASEAAPPAS